MGPGSAGQEGTRDTGMSWSEFIADPLTSTNVHLQPLTKMPLVGRSRGSMAATHRSSSDLREPLQRAFGNQIPSGLRGGERQSAVGLGANDLTSRAFEQGLRNLPPAHDTLPLFVDASWSSRSIRSLEQELERQAVVQERTCVIGSEEDQRQLHSHEGDPAGLRSAEPQLQPHQELAADVLTQGQDQKRGLIVLLKRTEAALALSREGKARLEKDKEELRAMSERLQPQMQRFENQVVVLTGRVLQLQDKVRKLSLEKAKAEKMVEDLQKKSKDGVGGMGGGKGDGEQGRTVGRKAALSENVGNERELVLGGEKVVLKEGGVLGGWEKESTELVELCGGEEGDPRTQSRVFKGYDKVVRGDKEPEEGCKSIALAEAEGSAGLRSVESSVLGSETLVHAITLVSEDVDQGLAVNDEMLQHNPGQRQNMTSGLVSQDEGQQIQRTFLVESIVTALRVLQQGLEKTSQLKISMGSQQPRMLGFLEEIHEVKSVLERIQSIALLEAEGHE